MASAAPGAAEPDRLRHCTCIRRASAPPVVAARRGSDGAHSTSAGVGAVHPQVTRAAIRVMYAAPAQRRQACAADALAEAALRRCGAGSRAAVTAVAPAPGAVQAITAGIHGIAEAPATGRTRATANQEVARLRAAGRRVVLRAGRTLRPAAGAAGLAHLAARALRAGRAGRAGIPDARRSRVGAGRRLAADARHALARAAQRSGARRKAIGVRGAARAAIDRLAAQPLRAAGPGAQALPPARTTTPPASLAPLAPGTASGLGTGWCCTRQHGQHPQRGSHRPAANVTSSYRRKGRETRGDPGEGMGIHGDAPVRMEETQRACPQHIRRSRAWL